MSTVATDSSVEEYVRGIPVTPSGITLALISTVLPASTAVSAVSSGVSNDVEDRIQGPNINDADDSSGDMDDSNTGNNSQAPSGGNGPLILDMDNIPEPDDAGDVW